MVDYNIQLVDVPQGCQSIFDRVIAKAPANIKARIHARGQTHMGQGTSWAGGYDTYEIYDARRPEWPTEDVERWRQEAEWSIIEHLNQQRELKVR